MKVVAPCQEKGLLKGKRVITDGALVHANASLGSLDTRDEREQRDKHAEAEVEKPKHKSKCIKGKKFSHKTHISATAPESTLAGKRDQPKGLYYKTHMTADRDTCVILDAHVTTGCVDESTVYLDRLKAVQEEFEIDVQEAITDRGYGSGEVIMELENQRIQTFIPLKSSQLAKSITNAGGFEVNVETNEVHCPKGHPMRAGHFAKSATLFSMSVFVSQNCPRYGSCVQDPRKRSGRRRGIRVPAYFNFI